MSVDDAFRKLMQNDSFSRSGVSVAASAHDVAVQEPDMAEPVVSEDNSVADGREDNTAIEPLDLARITRIQRMAHHPVDSRSQIAEEYRILRTRLLSLKLKKSSILITSCHHNEGKTSTALNLSLCLAKRKGARILLIDFDLRRPRLHKMLGLGKREYDIGSVLRGRCEPEDAILYSEDDNLYVLAANWEYADGTELLESNRTRELMERLHASFDFIVVDSCPCLSTSDPSILGLYVGGAVVVVRCLQTQRESIEHAISGMTDLGVEVVGVVLTFMRYFIPRYLYRYQYYHGYYYYRGYGHAYGSDDHDEKPPGVPDNIVDTQPAGDEVASGEPPVV